MSILHNLSLKREEIFDVDPSSPQPQMRRTLWHCSSLPALSRSISAFNVDLPSLLSRESIFVCEEIIDVDLPSPSLGRVPSISLGLRKIVFACPYSAPQGLRLSKAFTCPRLACPRPSPALLQPWLPSSTHVQAQAFFASLFGPSEAFCQSISLPAAWFATHC